MTESQKVKLNLYMMNLLEERQLVRQLNKFFHTPRWKRGLKYGRNIDKRLMCEWILLKKL